MKKSQVGDEETAVQIGQSYNQGKRFMFPNPLRRRPRPSLVFLPMPPLCVDLPSSTFPFLKAALQSPKGKQAIFLDWGEVLKALTEYYF